MLSECLFSIFQQNFNFSFEVIVVDNASTDGTVEMVKEVFPQVKLIVNSDNLGFAAANNLGLKVAQGRQLLLLNPDTCLIDNSLEEAVAFLNSQPQAGILGGKILNPNLTWQPSVRRFPRLLDHLLMMFKLHHLIPLERYLALSLDEEAIQEVEQVMGAFFLIKREVLAKIGLLDEKYFIWFEEVDFCRRAIKAGFKVYYYPGAQVIHYGGESFKQLGDFNKQWLFSRSRLRYLLRHHSFLAYSLILLLTPVSLFLSLINFKHGRQFIR